MPTCVLFIGICLFFLLRKKYLQCMIMDVILVTFVCLPVCFIHCLVHCSSVHCHFVDEAVARVIYH